MNFKEMTPEDIAKLVSLTSAAITIITKLGFLVSDVMGKLKDAKEEDIQELVKKIKEAQAALPAWE